MRAFTKAILGSTTVAGLATLAPLSLDPGAAGASPIRLATACGQAKDCSPAANYICVKPDRNVYEQKCSSGCGS
jgi:hypothetical protein